MQEKNWVLSLEIWNDLPPQIKNAENLFVFKQIWKCGVAFLVNATYIRVFL